MLHNYKSKPNIQRNHTHLRTLALDTYIRWLHRSKEFSLNLAGGVSLSVFGFRFECIYISYFRPGYLVKAI